MTELIYSCLFLWFWNRGMMDLIELWALKKVYIFYSDIPVHPVKVLPVT